MRVCGGCITACDGRGEGCLLSGRAAGGGSRSSPSAPRFGRERPGPPGEVGMLNSALFRAAGFPTGFFSPAEAAGDGWVSVGRGGQVCVSAERLLSQAWKSEQLRLLACLDVKQACV